MNRTKKLNPYYLQLTEQIVEKYGYEVDATLKEMATQLNVNLLVVHRVLQRLHANDLLTYQYISGNRKIYCINKAIDAVLESRSNG